MKQPEVKRLKEWLAQDGNSPLKLAALLGYNAQTTITTWIKNGRIPKWKVHALMAVIGEKTK